MWIPQTHKTAVDFKLEHNWLPVNKKYVAAHVLIEARVEYDTDFAIWL